MNSEQYTEGTCVNFAMWCDNHELTYSQGLDLAEMLSVELEQTALNRADYLPEEKMDIPIA